MDCEVKDCTGYTASTLRLLGDVAVRLCTKHTRKWARFARKSEAGEEFYAASDECEIQKTVAQGALLDGQALRASYRRFRAAEKAVRAVALAWIALHGIDVEEDAEE